MNADQTKAILTAATPAAAMVSLSQVNEIAALVGTIFIGMVIPIFSLQDHIK